MHNIVSQVLAEIVGTARFKWHAMILAWLVCVLGWIGVVLIPNTYESKAVLYIDTATVLRPLLADLAVNTDVMSEVRMMTEVLLSRPQLQRVVRETDLDLRAETEEDFEELLTTVRQRIQVSGTSARNAYNDKNLFTIKFEDKDPQTVYNVVQSLLDSFVDKSLGQNKADSIGAQDFIQDQVAQYEKRLAEAEQSLAEFKKANVGLMPSEGRDYYERLQIALDELEESQSEYNRVVKRRGALQKQIDGEEPTFGLLAAPGSETAEVSSGNEQVDLLEQELATLLLKYTEKHPRVVDLNNRIEQIRRLQEQRDAQAGSQPTYSLDTDLVSMNSLDLNPVYQSLKISIGEANAQLSELSEKIAGAQSRVAYLREMVDTMPEVEAQLARLNRDYEVNKTQHTALLKRLESARLSEEAEFRNEEIKFRIIEPPVVPLKPTGPNRYLFSTVVLLAGFGIGGAFAFLLNRINPVFNSTNDLREELQIPVLGSVSSYLSKDAKKELRQSTRRFSYAVIGLIALYISTLVLWPAADMIKEALTGAGVMV